MLKATRWKKYGKDRTYYVDEAGEKVGWVDNITGEVTGERPGGAEQVRAWLAEEAEWAGEQGSPREPLYAGALAAIADGVRPGKEPGPRKATRRLAGAEADLTEPDVDLALNRPGQAARERADEEYEKRKAEWGRLRAWAGKKLDLHTDERAWRVGAEAEETVGAELEKLVKHGWRVLHSVPVGSNDSDIDHVLIGPGGVYTVNTKHHPDAKVWVVAKQIRINNSPVPYLRNSRFEGERASRVLTEAAAIPVHVTPVLIFRLGDGSLSVKEEPGDVLVYRALRAYPAFKDCTGILTPEEVERVYEVARWRSTWASSR